MRLLSRKRNWVRIICLALCTERLYSSTAVEQIFWSSLLTVSEENIWMRDHHHVGSSARVSRLGRSGTRSFLSQTRTIRSIHGLHTTKQLIYFVAKLMHRGNVRMPPRIASFARNEIITFPWTIMALCQTFCPCLCMYLSVECVHVTAKADVQIVKSQYTHPFASMISERI